MADDSGHCYPPEIEKDAVQRQSQAHPRNGDAMNTNQTTHTTAPADDTTEQVAGLILRHAHPGEVLHVFDDVWMVCACGLRIDIRRDDAGRAQLGEGNRAWRRHLADEILALVTRPVECRWCPPGCKSCVPDDCECYTHQDEPDRALNTRPAGGGS